MPHSTPHRAFLRACLTCHSARRPLIHCAEADVLQASHLPHEASLSHQPTLSRVCVGLLTARRPDCGGHACAYVRRSQGHMHSIYILTGVLGPVSIPCTDSGRPRAIPPLPSSSRDRSNILQSTLTRRTV
ncbi:hypothetical protein FA95DRAFT_1046336 [Auriscalpium vulgare]|uniref:Uncharacterized protein n=1 Tax=Auriscalpium vulgare TaxID=40419 RepID=A0ACB8S8X0_9AGAM|nr:hypothetical protein FA95DRAFT_1046336 [Auriscalpium vulgare]